MIAQGAHAATAVLSKFASHPNTISYTSPQNLPRMTKVILECKNQNALTNVTDGLNELGLEYYTWVEMPEEIQTAVATVPYKRSQLGNVLKKCQLYRG